MHTYYLPKVCHESGKVNEKYTIGTGKSNGNNEKVYLEDDNIYREDPPYCLMRELP